MVTAANCCVASQDASLMRIGPTRRCCGACAAGGCDGHDLCQCCKFLGNVLGSLAVCERPEEARRLADLFRIAIRILCCSHSLPAQFVASNQKSHSKPSYDSGNEVGYAHR